MNTKSSSWLKKTAISWSLDGKQESGNPYWSREILELFHPISHLDEAFEFQQSNDDDECDFLESFKNQRIGSENQDEESSAISRVSYKTMLLLAAGVVQHIQQEFFDGASGNYNSDCRKIDETGKGDVSGVENITFAVTIPEGPMLPISILVVHALNVRLQQSSYAVLVPMDLDEGKDRNLHILDDAKPSFLLTIPGKDSRLLHELIDTSKGNNQNTSHNDNEFSIPTPRVLNMVNLVEAARKKLSTISSKISFESALFPSNQHNVQKCDSELIASTITSSTSLQSLVSRLANQIHILSTESIAFISEENNVSSCPFDSKLSHIVYTSGTTGRPKGCVSSTRSLLNYISAKNIAHDITEQSSVLLASALSFDPCLSDILASFDARATLAIAPRNMLLSGLTAILKKLKITHVLCTPTLWSLTLLQHGSGNQEPTSLIKDGFPHLQCIALGGEPIPNSLVQAWARPHPKDKSNENSKYIFPKNCRLLATYGVTEACVYQTCGEVFQSKVLERGQNVGYALKGTSFIICEEEMRGQNIVEVTKSGMTGEIVLYGNQIDRCSRYLNRFDLNEKFVAKKICINSDGDDGNKGSETTIQYYYRTGDRGYIYPKDRSLVVLGRIVGEEGMIKINGVRVELGEIESALTSGNYSDVNVKESFVTDCIAKCTKDSDGQNTIHAYCTFQENIWHELGLSPSEVSRMEEGIVINGGPLWTMLRIKCSNRLRKACIPSAFIGIRQLPLSRTGKRDRSRLPNLDSCSVLNIRNKMSTPLQNYGNAGSIVFETLVRYLNLQPCQQTMVTKCVSFTILGGDSLSAVVVCRTLYAHFNRLQNSRHLGGEYGQLPEPFNAASLLFSKNLGEYVDLLDQNIQASKLQRSPEGPLTQSPDDSRETNNINVFSTEISEKEMLYDALLQATTLNQTSIAVALLHLGADPNHGHDNRNRIGNTSGRIQRRAVFKTAPLHLACFRGDPFLVRLLLSNKANYKVPNTNGLFPIHLASGSRGDAIKDDTPKEEENRLECVKALLEVGCPLLMKDANKQSILHAAARAGHANILEHAIGEHKSNRYNGPVPLTQFLEFQDKWFRSALHWAVLHGKVKVVKLLLAKGSDPSPYKPRTNNRQTSMMAETPLEICRRVHANSDVGLEIEKVLIAAIVSRNTS